MLCDISFNRLTKKKKKQYSKKSNIQTWYGTDIVYFSLVMLWRKALVTTDFLFFSILYLKFWKPHALSGRGEKMPNRIFEWDKQPVLLH